MMVRAIRFICLFLFAFSPLAWGQGVPNSQDRTRLPKKREEVQDKEIDSILDKLRDAPSSLVPPESNLRKKKWNSLAPPTPKGTDENSKPKDAAPRDRKVPIVPRRIRKPDPLQGIKLPDLPKAMRAKDTDRLGREQVRKPQELIDIPPSLLKKEYSELPNVEAPNTGHSFRIATFNTHLISPIFNKDIFDSEHADQDAHVVANAIIEDSNSSQSFDVIVLNEVWDENAKTILVDALSPIFPYYVEKLDSPDGTTANAKISGGTLQVPKLEDSGLMLFSKLPIVELKVGTPTTIVKHAFHWFDACSGFDAAASKGVGAVSIYHPQANRHYLVAFTHLQDGDAEVRDSQMAEIRGFLGSLRSLNPEVRRGETFLLGDLNIEGVNLLEKIDPNWAPANEKQQEWVNHFLNKQSYFFYPLYDTWAWTTSAADQGFTNPGGNQRLDYIIHERESGRPMPYAVQHIHHVMVGDTDSDHIAVAADFNELAVASVPRLAFRPEMNTNKPENWWDYAPNMETRNDSLAGELAYPGSMQWYRFDQGGTFSMGVPVELAEAGLELTIYQANDLTTPIAVYNKESTLTLIGKDPPKPFIVGKYHIGTPPFFVRVSNPSNRQWNGKYRIAFHRHRGFNSHDAITLHPGEKLIDPEMPSGKPLNAEDAVWFEFVTDRAHSNLPQNMEILVENSQPGLLTMDLLEEDPIDHESFIKVMSTGTVAQPYLQKEELGGKKYFLTVQRKDINHQGFQVGWKTNLTWLVGMGVPGITWPFKLVCTDETDSDWTGSDEIVFQVFVDGQLFSKEYFDDVDTGDHYSYEGLIQPVAFLEKVETTICEIGAVDDPDCNLGKIEPLNKDLSFELRRWVDLFPDDGNYEFRFNLSHWLNK